jgi:hypothetical protein
MGVTHYRGLEELDPKALAGVSYYDIRIDTRGDM